MLDIFVMYELLSKGYRQWGSIQMDSLLEDLLDIRERCYDYRVFFEVISVPKTRSHPEPYRLQEEDSDLYLAAHPFFCR